MEKLFYTWDEQFDDTNKMCDQLEADEFIPDVVVGISRGAVSYTHLTLPTIYSV